MVTTIKFKKLKKVKELKNLGSLDYLYALCVYWYKKERFDFVNMGKYILIKQRWKMSLTPLGEINIEDLDRKENFIFEVCGDGDVITPKQIMQIADRESKLLSPEDVIYKRNLKYGKEE